MGRADGAVQDRTSVLLRAATSRNVADRLLHDVSSSMEGSKHRAACEAALQEMSACESTHFIVGAFCHDVVFPSRVPMTAAIARDAVRQLPCPSGGTALYRAVKEAAEIVERVLEEHAAEYDPRLAVIKACPLVLFQLEANAAHARLPRAFLPSSIAPTAALDGQVLT